jgi:hypothetical protein
MTGFILPTPRQPVTQSSPDTSKPAPDTAPPTPAVRRALSSARAGDLKALGAKDAPPEEDKSSASANAQRRQPLSAVLADLNKPRKGPPTSASLPASRAAIVPVKQSIATQQPFAELGHKAALDAPPLKLQNDIRGVPSGLIKNIGNGPPTSANSPALQAAAVSVEQNIATQQALAELGQKAALSASLLKLQSDMNEAILNSVRNIGSSVKSASR